MLKEALRFLRRNALLNGVALILLAPGIGLSTLALTLLLSLSSSAPPGARWMSYATIAEEASGGGSVPVSWKRFERLRSSSHPGGVLLAAYTSSDDALLGDGDSVRTIRVAAVSSGFFLGFTAPLAAGRDFDSSEESSGGQHAAILSVPTARALFGSPEAAVNHYIRINALTFEIVGVAPRNFAGLFGDTVDAWVPANCVGPLFFSLSDPSDATAAMPAILWENAPSFYLLAGSRMPSSAQLVVLNRMASARDDDAAPLHVSPGLTNDPVRDMKLRRWSRLGLLLALAFTIATSLNYGGLLLARASRSLEEVRLKRTFGATTSRLLGQLIVGPLSSVAIAFLVACTLCLCGLGFLAHRSAYWDQLVRGGWRSALVSLGVQILLVSILTLLIALAPALRLLRDSGAPRLGYTSTGSGRGLIILQGAASLQMASCIAACILAGAVLCAVRGILHEPLGYRPSRLIAARIGPAGKTMQMMVSEEGSFPAASAISSVLERLSGVPGVHSVSAALSVPLDRPMHSLMLQPIQQAPVAERAVDFDTVTQNYFRTIGSRIVRGSTFSSGMLTGTVDEVVVNQALERELWTNGRAVGRTVRLTAPGTGIVLTATVVGVVENMRFSGLTDAPRPTVFLPLRGATFTMGLPYIVADGTMNPEELIKTANEQLATLRPALRSRGGYSIGARAKELTSRERRRAFWTLAGASAIAITTCIGIYGMLSYAVSVRRRELAVRLCFGASSWAIRRIVLRQTVLCAAVAAVLTVPAWPALQGLAAAGWLGQMTWSPMLAGSISLACMAASVLLSLAPAAAATRVPPAEALKQG